MNKTYVKKLVEQETINAKIELVQEHINIAKIESKFYAKLKSYKNLDEQIRTKLISEFYENFNQNPLKNQILKEQFYIDSREKIPSVDDEGNARTVKDEIIDKQIPQWTSETAAAKAIEQMGGKIFVAGRNPYGYEVDAEITSYQPPQKDAEGNYAKDKDGNVILGKMVDTGKQDRIWLYDTGRAWSTAATIKFGWEYGEVTDNLNEMDKGDRERVLKILKENGVSGKQLKLFSVSRDTNVKLTSKQLWGVLQPGEEIVTSKYGGFYVNPGTTVKKARLLSFANLYDSENEDLAQDEQDAASPFWDTLQTILDWGGLIPGIGMAIDAVNALIYFIRYFIHGVKTYLYQGLLSLVAIIPLVGSAIALAFKGLFKVVPMKLFPLIWKGSKAAKGKFFDLLINAMGPKLSLKMSMGLAVIGKRIKEFFAKARKVFSFGRNKVDDIADGLVSQQKTMRQRLKQVGKQLRQKFPGLTAKAAAGYQKSQAWYHRITLNMLPKLRSAAWWPADKLKYIEQTLEMNFKSKAFLRPQKYFNDLDDVAKMTFLRQQRSGFGKILAASPNNAEVQALRNTPVGRWIDAREVTELPTPDQIKDFSSALNKFDKGSSVYKYRQTFTDDLVNVVRSDGNKMYANYTQSEANRLVAALNNKAAAAELGSVIPNWSKVNPYKDFTKRADVIYNEFQDFGEDTGIGAFGTAPENQQLDQMQGVVYALGKEAIGTIFPGQVEFVTNKATDIAPWLIKSAQATGTLALDTLGIDSGQFVAYNPEDEAGGSYA